MTLILTAGSSLIGVDTLVSGRSAVLGLFPEVHIDYKVSDYQFGYDIGRRDGILAERSVSWSFVPVVSTLLFYWLSVP